MYDDTENYMECYNCRRYGTSFGLGNLRSNKKTDYKEAHAIFSVVFFAPTFLRPHPAFAAICVH